MSYWPDNMKVDPIGTWPTERTGRPRRSQFASTLGTTLGELQRETRAIGARDVRLQIDLDPAKFRIDGKPRADAVPRSAGLILTFETSLGAQSFPCDAFDRWQDNLRAIVLSLEALRKVDRYGVTKRGEQYRGFLAIESATAMPAGFTSVEGAWRFILEAGGYDPEETRVAGRVRDAKRATHPDLGGRAETFQRVTAAEQYLKQNGAL
ncbi:hypothetical protein MN032_17740 [Agromyces atrinae]|uniref:hypothetical protein n=1 Tax=Agromyces atrinae TaxID=592376 RepID=UPI001F586F46|nr:hypothetical protein [Agromyces atrinae]MCI2959531.1 hypothetical protein [Agromyces atrinae]